MNAQLLHRIFLSAVCGLLPTLLCACASQSLKIPRDMSAIEIEVRAEPKAGYKPPTVRGSDYGTETGQSSGQFALVNYDALDDIVVWIERANSNDLIKAFGNLRVNLKDASIHEHPGITAATVGDALTIHNDSSVAQEVFLRSGAQIVELGTIVPGRERTGIIETTGLLEVMSEAHDHPIARIFAVHQPWVKVTRSGKKVLFNNVFPGEYHVRTWHPRLPGGTASVTLTPNNLSTASVGVGVDRLAQKPQQ